jgi:23S rRNA pseudouridine1911/1915/1917 synthase
MTTHAGEESEGEHDLEPFTFEVTPAESGTRIDRVIAGREFGPSRSAIQRFVEEGRVTQDGAPCDRRSKAKSFATVVVRPSPPPAYDAGPEDIPLDVLYEDAHVIVIDKPAGLVVHPAAGHESGTLVNALLHHTHVLGGESGRPGIVHRLDKDTSGVMIAAKSPLAHERLVATFQAHDLDREYVAIAVGQPPETARFDTFHARDPRDRKRFSSRVSWGRRAITHMRVLERTGEVARIACTLETGRTHQIRVHLSDAGFPLLGDPVYGRSISDVFVRGVSQTLARQALHARVLGLPHPITGEALRFEREPPKDFALAWEALRAHHIREAT